MKKLILVAVLATGLLASEPSLICRHYVKEMKGANLGIVISMKDGDRKGIIESHNDFLKYAKESAMACPPSVALRIMKGRDEMDQLVKEVLHKKK